MATDLDQTLIYSTRRAQATGGRDLVGVEQYQGRPQSFVTAAAAAGLLELAGVVDLLPVTTRTRRQLERVELPGPRPRFAVAANGGLLLVDGEPDARWSDHVRQVVQHAAPLTEVVAHVAEACRPEWTVLHRVAEELFCYAVVDVDRMTLEPAAERVWAAARGWAFSVQGRKLYWLPGTLTKAAAVAEVADRLGSTRLWAAGDSELDQSMLAAAEFGLLARHGELARLGWTAPHVHLTAAVGIAAGEEIVQRFLHAAQNRCA